MAQKQKRSRRLWLKIVLAIFLLIVILLGSCLAIITFWPDVAAQNIDRLRDVIGDAPVAQLEAITLSIQDRIQQLQYQAGLSQPAAPWGPATAEATTSQTTVAIQPTATVQSLHQIAQLDPAQVDPTQPAYTPTLATVGTVTIKQPTSVKATQVASNPTRQSGTPPVTSPTRPPTTQATGQANLQPTATPQAVAAIVPMTSNASSWKLSPLTSLGRLPGEGQWSPYLSSSDGKHIVAYRTYLQPDVMRPYSIAAIVAFDLQATHLHFLLGTVDPVPEVAVAGRAGTIPAADEKPGTLLATFNGGFKARHGHYGAMAGGFVALPPIDGLATVALYSNGTVQIGLWGQDIKDSPDLVAWRQNGDMLIYNGQINPETADVNANWGRTIKGDSVTWRSAIGLSADGRTFYYVAGPHLDVPALARAMATAGISEAMQLDVNDYWVDFAAIRSDGLYLVAEPLLSSMKAADRFLKTSERDFFYVTATTP